MTDKREAILARIDEEISDMTGILLSIDEPDYAVVMSHGMVYERCSDDTLEPTRRWLTIGLLKKFTWEEICKSADESGVQILYPVKGEDK